LTQKNGSGQVGIRVDIIARTAALESLALIAHIAHIEPDFRLLCADRAKIPQTKFLVNVDALVVLDFDSEACLSTVEVIVPTERWPEDDVRIPARGRDEYVRLPTLDNPGSWDVDEDVRLSRCRRTGIYRAHLSHGAESETYHRLGPNVYCGIRDSTLVEFLFSVPETSRLN
jgi:hypothetical protein